MAAQVENIFVEKNSGRVVSFLGTQCTFKIAGAQTSEAFSIIQGIYPSGNFTPPHRHEKTTEVSYILDGELGFMVAEEDFIAGPGTFVVRPKGVPHALWNTSGRPVQFLDVYTPAGMESWFVELARLTSGAQPPTLEQLFDAGQRYDTIFMPELAPPLIKKYGLKMAVPGPGPSRS